MKSKNKIFFVIIMLVILAGFIGVYSLPPSEQYIGPGPIYTIAEANATVTDKDNGPTENFVDGKVAITITMKHDDIDDVLYPTNPMKIMLAGQGKQWNTGYLNLSDSGKTEANYGETIEMDGVLDISGMGERLYVKVSVPTTSNGDFDMGMSIRVDIWPTTDATSTMDGTISPALHDTATTEDWWNENDIIDIYISGRGDNLSLTESNGAYLYPKTV